MAFQFVVDETVASSGMSIFARVVGWLFGASDATPAGDDGDAIGADGGDGGGGGSGGSRADVVVKAERRPSCACCGEKRLGTSRSVAADSYDDLSLLTGQVLDAAAPHRLCEPCFTAFGDPKTRILTLAAAFAVSGRSPLRGIFHCCAASCVFATIFHTCAYASWECT